MNKDELSALKISHRAEAAPTPQPICDFSKEKKALPPSIYLFLILTGLSFQSCTLEHSGHLRKAMWLSGWLTSRPVRWKPFTLHLLAPSTLSPGQRCENATDTLITGKRWRFESALFESAFIRVAQPVFYSKLQLFPYFVYYMSLVIDFYPQDLDILSAPNNLSIEAYGKRNLN